jgi:threonine/homoserine/homoserine lactone efflux protein
MGLYTLLFKKLSIDKDAETGEKQLSTKDLLGSFVSGYLMNTLNPNVFLFWFAWTAAIDTSASETNNPLYYKLIVFGTCLVFVFISDLAKVVLAGRLRPRLTNKTMLLVNRISGIIILIFSAALFYTALHY